MKFIIIEIITLKFGIELVTNSYEEIIEIIMQTNKIKNLSIFFICANLLVL